MKYIRLLFFSFLFLFLLVTGISFFIPSRVRISKAINVKASTEAIWQQVGDMNKWKGWNPFFEKVPAEKMANIDTVHGVTINGTTIQWRQKNRDEYIAAMERAGKNPVLNGWKCITHGPASDSTTVQWYMDFHLSWYPWEKFSSLLFEKSYGFKMETGLSNLKRILETDRTSNKP